MKKPILIILLLACVHIVNAQQDTGANKNPDLLNQPASVVKPPNPFSDNQIFTAVQDPPNYPGGSEKLHNYVDSCLRNAHNQNEGQEVVQFVVERDGSLSYLKVLRGINSDADALAINVMKNAKFNAGMQNGHAVRCYYTVVLRFTPQQ